MTDIFAHAWSVVLGEKYEIFLRIKNYFSDFKTAWQHFDNIACHTIGIDQEKFNGIKQIKKKTDPNEEASKLISQKISIVTINESGYPKLLKEIAKPPITLYYKGNLNSLHNLCIGVVGTRQNSIYGDSCTRKIVSELCDQKVTIVSGFARGIDFLAHKYSLEFNALTAAVLAGGLKRLYPSSHHYLADKIIDAGGILVSEFPPHIGGQKYHFLRRNRVISGLSRAVCVIECPKHSGAMNTAEHAFHQNRNVYVVPGDIGNANSQGPLHLLQSLKAAAIDHGHIILKDLDIPLRINGNDQQASFSSDDMIILNVLSASQALSMQEIIEGSGLSLTEASQTLFSLEIDGHVKKSHTGYTKTLS